MTETAAHFIARSTAKAEDRLVRRSPHIKDDAVVPAGKQQFADLRLARERAKNTKWKAIEHLDKQLEEFETAFSCMRVRSSGRKRGNRFFGKYWLFAKSEIMPHDRQEQESMACRGS